MDKISIYTNIDPPYKKLCPHITFHRPIVGIDEQVIKNLVHSMSLQSKKTRITVSGIYAFGTHYIVLPVHTTNAIAKLWTGIHKLLASVPEYEHGVFDHDNTLHITLAEKTSEVFTEIWPKVKNIYFTEITIPVENIELYKKEPNGIWQKVSTYELCS
ncbi:MAG: 2'-5' RNA ligase family protein [bacterium]